MRRIYYINENMVSMEIFFDNFSKFATYEDIVNVLDGAYYQFNDIIYRVSLSEGDFDYFYYDIKPNKIYRCYINKILTPINEFTNIVEKELTEKELKILMSGLYVVKYINGEKIQYNIREVDEFLFSTAYPPTIEELEKTYCIIKDNGKEIKYSKEYFEEIDSSVYFMYEKTIDRAEAIMKWENAHSDKPIYHIPYCPYDINFRQNEIEVITREDTTNGKIEHTYTIPFYKFPNNDWHDDFIENVKIEREKKKLAEKE